jgi:hypothetical protein
MEPISLTLSVLSVSGLFSAGLEAIDQFSAAKTYGEDCQLFVTKTNIERLRIVRWGQAVGLVKGGVSSQQHESLHDLEVRGAVCELLAWAVCFFGYAKGVKKQHGVRGSGFITFLPRSGSSIILSALNYSYRRERAEKLQKQASAFNKLKWAFSNKRKSGKLLHELTWFVDKLHELVPIAVAIRGAGHCWRPWGPFRPLQYIRQRFRQP